MAPLPGLQRDVFQDPAPPAVDFVASPIVILDGTTLVTTKTTNETIANVDELIDYVSGDNVTFIPQAAIDSLVSDLSARELLVNKVTTIGTPGNNTNYGTEKAVRDALNLKEDSLGFTPEDSANKGAVSGYAGLDAFQELLLANFPSGTALQVLRRNTVNDGLEFFTLTDLEGIVSINADTTAAQIIAGTASRITVGTVSGTTTIDIDAVYIGQTSITTLGTITTGVWNGTDIDGANIDAELTDLSDVTAKTGTGTVVVMDTSPTIVTPTIVSFVNATHNHQDAAGGGQLLSTSALSDTADIAYLNTDNTFLTNTRQTFTHQASKAGIALAAVAGDVTAPNDGEFWYNLTTDKFRAREGGVTVDMISTGGAGTLRLVKLEGITLSTDREGLNFVDTATINFTVTDDVGNDEADVIAAIVDGSVVDAQIGTHTSTKITITAKGQLNSAIVYNDQANTYTGAGDQDFASSALRNVSFVESDAAAPATAGFIRGGNADDAIAWRNFAGTNNIDIIVNASDAFLLRFDGTSQYIISATEFDFTSANIINLGTLNTHTVPGGTSTFALISDNLSVFAATTSLQLLGVISDETGSGLLVFNDTPTLLTPTIADFTNATHDHIDAAGGGVLGKAAIPSATVYEDEANTWGAFDQNIAATGKWQEGGVDISPIGIHDIGLPATAYFLPTFQPATGLTNINFPTNDIDKKVFEFATGVDQRIQTTIYIPRNWDEGNMDIELNWSFAAGTGSVRWGMRFGATGDNEAIDNSFGGASIITDLAGAANELQKIIITNVSMPAGIVAGDEIQVEVFRQGANAGDTFDDTARLHGTVLMIRTDAAVAAP